MTWLFFLFIWCGLWAPFFWCCCGPGPCAIAASDLNLELWTVTGGIPTAPTSVGPAVYDPDGGGTGIPVWSACFERGGNYVNAHLGCIPGFCIRTYNTAGCTGTLVGFSDSNFAPNPPCIPTVLGWTLDSESYSPTDITWRSTAPGPTIAYYRFFE